MKELFVLVSEIEAFQSSHPEYNNYEEVHNKFGELIGYNASIVEENKD